MLTIALSKGRIFDETLPLLAAAGIAPAEDPETSRKLIIGSNRSDVRFIVVRASDVPTYVQRGAADLGVAGKDVLLEHGGEGLYQPVDLGIGPCRMVVAAKAGFEPVRSSVARAFPSRPSTSRRASISRQGHACRPDQALRIDGLAPLVGHADAIVDLVSSGNTLDQRSGRGGRCYGDQRATDRQSTSSSSARRSSLLGAIARSARAHQAPPQPASPAYVGSDLRGEMRRLDSSAADFAAALGQLTAVNTAGQRSTPRSLSSSMCGRVATPPCSNTLPPSSASRRPRWPRWSFDRRVRSCVQCSGCEATQCAGRAAEHIRPTIGISALNRGRTPKPMAHVSVSRSHRWNALASMCRAARRPIHRRCS